jgi:RNA polymerase sigma-70 factor (ECF subfamily)
MTALNTPDTVDAWAEDVIRINAPDLLTYLVRRTEPAADAADVLSNALLVIWDRRDRIPTDPTEARMWSFGVARNVLRDYRRQGVRQSALADALRDNLLTALPSSSGTDPLQVTEHRDRIQYIRAAVANLKESDRELITLIHWDAFTLAEAAAFLGINASTARTRYARARNRLAVELSSQS